VNDYELYEIVHTRWLLHTVFPTDNKDNVDEMYRSIAEFLNRRDLHLACGVFHLFLIGTHPSKIRISRMDPIEMEGLLRHKKLGNEAFAKKDYERAIECYDDALGAVLTDLYVSPKDQVKEVIDVLSNQAECHLRLKQYKLRVGWLRRPCCLTVLMKNQGFVEQKLE
jgi:hypothetical protein